MSSVRIEITTSFETSYVNHYKVTIIARVMKTDGSVLAIGKSVDDTARQASTKAAVADALEQLDQVAANARDVAQKTGLL